MGIPKKNNPLTFDGHEIIDKESTTKLTVFSNWIGFLQLFCGFMSETLQTTKDQRWSCFFCVLALEQGAKTTTSARVGEQGLWLKEALHQLSSELPAE